MTNQRSRVTAQAKHSTGGYELVLAGALFGVFGFWLDQRLDTFPWVFLALTLAGFIGSGLALYYRYQRDIERLQAETAELQAQARARARDNS